MKKKYFLLIPVMLVLMLLTACHREYQVEIRCGGEPDRMQMYLMLRKEYGTPSGADPSELPLYDVEDDGYVVAQGRFEYVFGNLSTYSSAGRTLSLDVSFMEEEEAAQFCENFKTCKLLFRDMDTNEIVRISPELNLVSEQKFGYPKTVNYDYVSNSFEVIEWREHMIYGLMPRMWEEKLFMIGIPLLAIIIICLVVIGVSAVRRDQKVPWALIWILSVVGSVPLIAITVYEAMKVFVPYFRMEVGPVTATELEYVAFTALPWGLLMLTVCILHLSDRHKRKKIQK